MSKSLITFTQEHDDEISFWDDGTLYSFGTGCCDSVVEVELAKEKTKKLYLAMKKYYGEE